MDSALAAHPAALCSILGIPKNFSLDVAETYWQHCLEQWQRLDNVNRTHLVMASGKLVLQKTLLMSQIITCGQNEPADDESLETHLKLLRRKIGFLTKKEI